MLAADAARLSGHPASAVPYLRRMLRDYPSDVRGPVAAFTLGRVLLAELARPGEAADAFALSYRLAPAGPLAADALGPARSRPRARARAARAHRLNRGDVRRPATRARRAPRPCVAPAASIERSPARRRGVRRAAAPRGTRARRRHVRPRPHRRALSAARRGPPARAARHRARHGAAERRGRRRRPAHVQRRARDDGPSRSRARALVDRRGRSRGDARGHAPAPARPRRDRAVVAPARRRVRAHRGASPRGAHRRPRPRARAEPSPPAPSRPEARSSSRGRKWRASRASRGCGSAAAGARRRTAGSRVTSRSPSTWSPRGAASRRPIANDHRARGSSRRRACSSAPTRAVGQFRRRARAFSVAGSPCRLATPRAADATGATFDAVWTGPKLEVRARRAFGRAAFVVAEAGAGAMTRRVTGLVDHQTTLFELRGPWVELALPSAPGWAVLNLTPSPA